MNSEPTTRAISRAVTIAVPSGSPLRQSGVPPVRAVQNQEIVPSSTLAPIQTSPVSCDWCATAFVPSLASVSP